MVKRILGSLSLERSFFGVFEYISVARCADLRSSETTESEGAIIPLVCKYLLNLVIVVEAKGQRKKQSVDVAALRIPKRWRGTPACSRMRRGIGRS